RDLLKAKMPKLPKKGKDSALTLKIFAMERKKKEVNRVLNLKSAILVKSEVSYLEYIEMRSEMERLKALKDTFVRRIEKLKQQAN
ncbi:hypothetical protein KR093_001171, partial [Drosophila rubida]